MPWARCYCVALSCQTHHGISIGSYTTAIPTQNGILGGLTRALREKLKKNAIVITTDYQLGEGFSLLISIEGENPGVGGERATGGGG